jgi:hypothetical protein
MEMGVLVLVEKQAGEGEVGVSGDGDDVLRERGWCRGLGTKKPAGFT